MTAPATKTVVAVEPVRPDDPDGFADVYDLTVPGPHAYAAGGVFVGNSKRLSLLDTNALIAHGGTEVLKDAVQNRGQANEAFWLAFMRGNTPPEPGLSLPYQKFQAQLRAAGVGLADRGGRQHLMALTDSDVDLLSQGREVTSADALRDVKGELRPAPGGLFDPAATGGHGGDKWAKLRLTEPVVNPAFEDQVRRLLKLTGPQFEAVAAGTESLPGGRTGGAGIKDALAGLDVDAELGAARAAFAKSRGAGRDAAARRIADLKALKRTGLNPADLVLSALPVLPPRFRPVSLLPDGTPMSADANALYLQVMEADRLLKGAVEAAGPAAAGPERLALYRATKALVGLADPDSKVLKQKQVRGLLADVFGSAPKHSSVQRSLLSTTLDNVARGVAAVGADLDMDSVGMPADAAFAAYGRYVARRLHRQGLPMRQALAEVRDRTDRARAALGAEMDERPAILGRAPTLHKFNQLAVRPRLIDDKVIRVSPLVFKGFGLDLDGDQVNLSVPASEEAVREAYDRLLPSRNLFYPATMTTPMHQFGTDYVAGLHRGTAEPDGRGPAREFPTRAAAVAAARRGQIGWDQPVRVAGD